jgi:hypothetical protein
MFETLMKEALRTRCEVMANISRRNCEEIKTCALLDITRYNWDSREPKVQSLGVLKGLEVGYTQVEQNVR